MSKLNSLAKLSLTLVGSTMVALGVSNTAHAATTYVEDFNDPFPQWESGWLGQKSNLQNYYGVGAGRGNNPDGLWIDDGDGIRGTDTVEIVFDQIFGASLNSLAIDIAGYVPITFQVFDKDSNLIFSNNVTLTRGGTSNPGVYTSLSVTSTNGISGFSFVSSGSQVEGNTSIDNVVVTTGTVPEPLTILGATTAIVFGVGFKGQLRKAKHK